MRRKLFALLRNAGAQFVVVPVTLPMMEEAGLGRARGAAMLAALRLWSSVFGRAATGVERAVLDGPSLRRLGIDGIGEECGLRLEAVEGADGRYRAVAAASIVAKVYVDALFEGYGRMWPEYGMERDHGSVSGRHKKALRAHGPSAAHRFRGYAPDWWRELVGYVPSRCIVR